MAITSNLQPVSRRDVLDANYIVTVAGPAAAATVNTNAIDLGPFLNFANGTFITTGDPYSTDQYVTVQVKMSASACTSNSKNTNIVLQYAHSNSDGTVNASNWTNIAVFANPLLRVTDSSGNTPAGAVNVTLPPDNMRRFIRAQGLLEANGNTANDATITLQLKF